MITMRATGGRNCLSERQDGSWPTLAGDDGSVNVPDDRHPFPQAALAMRWISFLTLLIGLAVSSYAHHPDRRNQPVHPYYDLIGPLGNRLPPSYRRRYNRPRYVGGKIAYHIAPSSQEAMSWHQSVHRGDYRNKRGRIETHYFYPKPWEALPIGARRPAEPSQDSEMSSPYGRFDSKDSAADAAGLVSVEVTAVE